MAADGPQHTAEYAEPEVRCPHYGFSDLSLCGICCGVDS